MNKIDIPSEIKSLKKLLDAGIITQEEFDKKKRDLFETPEERQKRLEYERNLQEYNQLCEKLKENSKNVVEINELKRGFEKLGDFENAICLKNQCEQEIKQIYEEDAYNDAAEKIQINDIKILKKGREVLKRANGIKDSDVLSRAYDDKIYELETLRKNKIKRIVIVFVVIVVATFSCFSSIRFIYLPWKVNKTAYDKAYALYESEEYIKASKAFSKLSGFKDSDDMSKKALEMQEQKLLDIYSEATELLKQGKYDEASQTFSSLGDYSDSADMVKETKYQKALFLLDSCEYEEAATIFTELEEYADSQGKYSECEYKIGEQYFNDNNIQAALDSYKLAGAEYESYRFECDYILGQNEQQNGNWKFAIDYYSDIGYKSDKFDEVKKYIKECKYNYLIEHTSTTGASYEEFLKDLYKDDDYKSKVSSIYKEFYKWNVEVYAINDSEFSESNMESISHYSEVYFHFRVTGGDGSYLKLRYVGHLPDCYNNITGEIDGLFLEGDEGNISLYYEYFGSYPRGTAWLKIYNDDTGEELEYATVNIY